MMEMPELFKAREVAILLRLNTKSLYTHINKGLIRVIRTPTGGIRVPKEEVVRLLGEVEEPARLKAAGLMWLPSEDADEEGVDEEPQHV